MSGRGGRRRSLLVLSLLAVALGPAPARALPDVTKPGPFAVGVTNLTFTKTSVTTGASRPLDTVIWYPAVRDSGTVTPIGRRDATVLGRRFPLLLFSHGLCGFPEQSVFLTAALASWGLVVAAPPHPGNLLADGIPACVLDVVDSFANRVADVRFTLDAMLAESRRPGSPFEHRVSARRIGMSGHSLGGQTTLRVALGDRRVQAALALAPALMALVEPGTIRIPSMIQGGQLDSMAPFAIDSTAAFGRLVGPRFLLEILNTGHYAFADVCPVSFLPPSVHDCDPGTLAQDEAHTAVLRFAVPFVLRYVAGQRRFARLLTPASVPAGVVLRATPRP